MNHYSAVRRVLIISMFFNLLAAAVKLWISFQSNSLSIQADAFDTLFDGLSNIIGLAGIAVAARPPDKNHPYGHRKFETIAALLVSFLLLLTGWELLQGSIGRLREPVTPLLNLWGVLALLFSLVVQGLTAWYEQRQGERLHSELLLADAAHSKANVAVSLAALAGALLATRGGVPLADPVLALAIVAVIVKMAVDIILGSTRILVDEAAVDPAAIEAVTLEVQGVEFCHRIRSRGSPGFVAVDLHIHVSRRLPIAAADRIADEVRERLLLKFPEVQDVTVHVEPRVPPGYHFPGVFEDLKVLAAPLNVSINEAWAWEIEGSQTLELHVGVDRRMSLQDAHAIVTQLERSVLGQYPALKAVHTHIEFANDAILAAQPVPEATLQRVRDVAATLAAENADLLDCHNVVAGERDGQLFISLECTVNPTLSIEAAHHLSSWVEDRLQQRLPHVDNVLVHVEPPGADEEPPDTRRWDTVDWDRVDWEHLN